MIYHPYLCFKIFVQLQGLNQFIFPFEKGYNFADIDNYSIFGYKDYN